MFFFVSRFPVSRDATKDAFLRAFIEWIAAMRTSKLNLKVIDSKILALNARAREVSFEQDGERIDGCFSGELADSRLVGLRYSKSDKSPINWLTEAILSETNDGDVWVTVRASYEITRIDAVPPVSPKPPQLPRLLIQALKGGMDGSIETLDREHSLTSSNVEFVADAMRGKLGNRLPIIYCSADFQGVGSERPQRLARRLYGSAHIFSEPDRYFSNRLRLAVNGFNAYGGSIGVYWPDGTQRRLFYLNADLPSDMELESAIVEYVQQTAREFRLPPDAYWTSIQERLRAIQFKEAAAQSHLVVSKNEAEAAEAKKDSAAYIDTFDAEVTALKAERHNLSDELALAEAEILRLKTRLHDSHLANVESGVPVTIHSTEQDFYACERQSIVIDAIQHYLNNACVDDSRRMHIIQDMLKRNSPQSNVEEKLKLLKTQFEGFRALTPPMRSTLGDLGFSISDIGAHVKLTWFDDDRYTFTLPKSGSDSRGGRNSFADLRRLFF